MNAKQQKLLIVDDTPANIQILHQIFQHEYAVFFATSGMAAIELAKRELPDIILLDIMMHEMDGYEVCSRLKGDQTTAAIPVVFVTAMGEEEDETRGLEAGAIDYITKPISPPIVKARVKNHLELKTGRDLLATLAEELSARNRTLEQEKALAHSLLTTILPESLHVDGFSTAVRYRPSDQIGGDFFDGWREDEYAHFLVADISGHSTSAALLMAVCKGLFMTIGKGKSDPAEILTIANRMLTEMLADSGMYLTMVYAVFNTVAQEVTIASAGHNQVYLYSHAGITAVAATGPPLGWDSSDEWGVERHRFTSAEKLLFYTDGLIEVRNSDGFLCSEEIFNLANAADPPNEIVSKIMQASEDHCSAHFEDDVTLLAIGIEEKGEDLPCISA